MLFKQHHLAGIKSGKISLAFRKWKKPAVKKGSLVKTAIGQVEIISVDEIKLSQISEKDANNAGFDSRDDLLELLDSIETGTLYKIRLRYHSPDPRVALRSKATMTTAEFTTLEKKLHRLDTLSRQGAWTLPTLITIRDNPELRAADLAKKLNKEKDWLKLNIRKLKNLGLTISHETGYSISPLGQALLERYKR